MKKSLEKYDILTLLTYREERAMVFADSRKAPVLFHLVGCISREAELKHRCTPEARCTHKYTDITDLCC